MADEDAGGAGGPGDATRWAALFERVLDASPDAIVVVDGGGRITHVNRRAEAALLWPRAELAGLDVGTVVPAAAAGGDAAQREAFLRGPSGAAGAEPRRLRAVRRDGSEFPADVALTSLASARGAAVVAVIRDVSALVLAEEAARRSDERYRKFFEQTPSGAWISRAEGAIVVCNPAFVRMFGFASVTDAIGRDAATLFADPSERARLIEEAGRDGAIVGRFLDFRCVDGSVRHGLLNMSAVKDAQGNVVKLLNHVLDVTEAHRLEEKLRQGQKLEALGRLAGGVAHDFNNLLTAITGFSELILRSLDSADTRHAWCREILATSERAANLTRQLLAFSRRQPAEPTVLDVADVVASLRKMLGRIAGEKVTLKVVRDAGPHRVRADRTQIEQVLLNLTVNACDAMPRGGNLVIGVRALILPEAPGRWIELSAADDGVGMSPDVMDRAFEPFFTTKEQGTGLGLSTVYGIVEQSGGRISVESSPGRGTTFRIVLPGTSAEVARAAAGGDAGPPSGAGTVLVVEDDPQVRELARRALEGFGYTAIAADTPAEALRILGTAQEVALLLTDVVMPGMGGGDLADAARALRPALPVLFMSGYAEDAMVRTRLLSTAGAFLEKPFTPTALARKVAEAMATE